MFTGIVETTAKIKKINNSRCESELTIENPFKNGVAKGDSIAIDGVCLSVENFSDDYISFFLSKTTLKNSLAKSYLPGFIVNLERAMTPNGRLGGHIVLGHVDCCGTIVSVEKIGLGKEIAVRFPAQFSDFLVQRGSICVNGVSLTTSTVANDSFTVSLIPETLKATSFSQNLKEGRVVNLEFDVIGKYVAKLVGKPASSDNFEELLSRL